MNLFFTLVNFSASLFFGLLAFKGNYMPYAMIPNFIAGIYFMSLWRRDKKLKKEEG